MSVFEDRRRNMVDTQIRPSDVTKFPIIEAMLTVPRERFVPGGQEEAAYVGENLALAPGRVVLEPRTLAKMLDSLDIQVGEVVLDVGAGLGYSTAILARLADAVVAVEDDGDMAGTAQDVLLSINADNVAVIEAPLTEGAPKHGPYDAIIVEGAVQHVPDALLDQLKDGGRIAALFSEGSLGVVKIGYKTDGSVSWRFAFNAGAPILPGFEAPRRFVL
ncbi:protein-L-isoaspartate O-methyltransferase [Actibacterium sp. 188UL27-1]|uniref:protein-L-isoaspartate O-methyltransferase family protein n=1 Tax=Actibacterium sp. 188UL27-1 TaxID=2786961 RepID=UPI00195855B0|nr:protein-L-isoaspartate O-methyltransferase [Actibacterium sp. 188UL27-1]MBM7069424.1 protein-L-isoaspartate O-methyltransferase [Actibacterium sp. 188UL27-1]